MGSLISLNEAIPPGNREESLGYFEKLFGSRNPLIVELGSGNGHFLVEYAVNHPEKNFLGTEILQGRARKFQEKIEKRNLSNVVVFKGEIRRFVWEFLYEGSVDEFIVLFPDPWPKKRHHKHRLLQKPFINMLNLRLVPGGFVSVATDYPEYREWILAEFSSCGGFRNLFTGGYSNYPEEYPETLFLQRFIKEGRDVSFMRFKKN